MEQFPPSFQAQKIQHDVVVNRIKKIEQNLRLLRQKIVKAFHGNVHYHIEVSHEMLPDLSEEEGKNFYCLVKDELQQRGFVVRGKITGHVLSLIVFSNAPRTNEMDRVLKAYSDDEGNDSRSSTPNKDVVRAVASVPNSPATLRHSRIPLRKSKKSRSSSIPLGGTMRPIARKKASAAAAAPSPQSKTPPPLGIEPHPPLAVEPHPPLAVEPHPPPSPSAPSIHIPPYVGSSASSPPPPPHPVSPVSHLSERSATRSLTPLSRAATDDGTPDPTVLNMDFIRNKLQHAHRKK